MPLIKKMAEFDKTKASYFQIERYGWILLIIWTVFFALSLTWNIIMEKQNILEIAHAQALTAYEKDILYRRWNTMHGGVYVPVSENAKPNPYITNKIKRDITTRSGELLTLINPAYMTRQVHELAEKEGGVLGHITSLDPIRPANAPDPWERKGLKAFEAGENELHSVENINGKEYMRVIRPLITEKACLKCHADQGYIEGDIRGGISVSLPMEPLRAIEMSHMGTLIWAHVILWLLGVAGGSITIRRLKGSEKERRLQEEEIKLLAETDPLTGIYNRRMFFDYLEIELLRTKRYGNNLSLIMLDIDYFKKVNDTYGHDVGDYVLRTIVDIVKEKVREADILARYGGEEFIIILPETDIGGAKTLAEKIRILIEKNIFNKVKMVTVSIGVTSFQEGDTVATFTKRVDNALYKAKNNGRNRVETL